jgi:hypothetical protein
VKTVELTRAEFDALPEYSCSLPSGTTIGKKWKCNDDAYAPEPRRSIAHVEEQMADVFPEWWMGQYVALDPPHPNQVGIEWHKIRLKE